MRKLTMAICLAMGAALTQSAEACDVFGFLRNITQPVQCFIGFEEIEPETETETEPQSDGDAEENDGTDETTGGLVLLNNWRVGRGLPRLKLDLNLQRCAETRLRLNVQRNRWGHNIIRGRIIGPWPGGKTKEGCGIVNKTGRWHTCHMGDVNATHAGCAMQVVRGQVWQLLLVR